MKTEHKKQNGLNKITVTAKVPPELKISLSEEANSLGLTLSEYIEMILLKRGGLVLENAAAKMEIEENKSNLQSIRLQLADAHIKLKTEKEQDETEKKELRMMNADLINQTQLLRLPQLLVLYNELKGKEDTITLPDGSNFSFVYQKPEDLVWVMIQTYSLKK